MFDYRDPDAVKKIKAVAPNLTYVFDTIGNETSSATASKAIAESGGGLCTVRPGKTFTENVSKQTKVTDVLVWTAFLKDHRYGDFHWPVSEPSRCLGRLPRTKLKSYVKPNKADHELAAELFDKLPTWLVEGRIKPNQAKVFEGGLNDVSKGFQEYRDGTISNYKIVYKL